MSVLSFSLLLMMARLSVNLELPIGTRVEIAKEAIERLYGEWSAKYPKLKL